MLNPLKRLLKIPKRSLSLFEKAWLFAPVAVWFSYHPLVHIGSNSSMNFEFSITVLYVAALAICGLSVVWRNRIKLLSDKTVLPVTVFVLISGISLGWTADLTRGVLTFGLLGTIYLIYLASIAEAPRLVKIGPALMRIFVLSALAIGSLAVVQMIAGVWLGQEAALLCRGCTAQQFGFVRPNVFAIEPQFLGSLLLTPALFLLYKFIKQRKHNQQTTVALFFVTTILLLTLSRGAIFAFVIAAVALVAVAPSRLIALKKFALIMAPSFIICLLLQSAVASINPKLNTTFAQTIRTSINQLSMGLVSLPVPEKPTDSTPKTTPSNKATKQPKQTASQASKDNKAKTPVFDGYVEESTNIRLKLSSLGLQAWQETPSRLMFGVGIGGSGLALRKTFPEQVNQREIVQNQYVETLLENGLIGLLTLTFVLGALIYQLRHMKWFWSIVIAFMVQWNFFSGYPNALHIYLVLIFLAVIGSSLGRRDSKLATETE